MKKVVIYLLLAFAGICLLSSCGVSYAAYSEPDAVVIVEGGYHYTPWYYPYYGYRYYRPVPPPRHHPAPPAHHHPAPSHHNSTPHHGGHVSPPSHGGHVSPPSHGGGSHGGHGPSHAPSGGHRR